MIELADGDYIIGVWVAPLPDLVERPGNLMAALWRRGTDWHFVYRFRYFVDDLIFDSQDEKRWYRCTIPPTESEDAVKRVVEGVFAKGQMTPTFYDVHGGPEQFQAVVMEADDFCVRMEHERPT